MLSNKVKEIMTRDVLTVPVTDSIAAVIALMAEKNVGRVVVIDRGVPTGIFTESDVLRRVVAKRLDARKHPIKKVMTSPVRGVSEDTHILDVLGKMYRGKFRHMLVRGQKKEMAGLVSMRRILKFAVELGRDLKETETIGSIMTGRPLTVEFSRSIHEVLGAMVREEASSVVVLDQGAPAGILTERDVLRRVAVKKMDLKKTPVKKVMTPAPVFMNQAALIGEVLVEMFQRDFRHMPIQDDAGNLTGVVSLYDVLKYARALDVDEGVRRAWQEIKEYWDSEEQYTPG